jgi:hypothetical protein
LTVEAEETEMSNPHDDPGHRPPQPRQGEPQPYQGGPPPPPHQPPPGAPWQGPGGYGPPPQHSAPPPGYASGRGKGFFGALFDMSFDHMVTTRLIKLFYVLAIVIVSCSSLAIISIGIWVAQLRNGWFLGVVTICFTPVIWLFQLVIVRIVMEVVINQFKITEHLKAMRERDGLR